MLCQVHLFFPVTWRRKGHDGICAPVKSHPSRVSASEFFFLHFHGPSSICNLKCWDLRSRKITGRLSHLLPAHTCRHYARNFLLHQSEAIRSTQQIFQEPNRYLLWLWKGVPGNQGLGLGVGKRKKNDPSNRLIHHVGPFIFFFSFPFFFNQAKVMKRSMGRLYIVTQAAGATLLFHSAFF